MEQAKEICKPIVCTKVVFTGIEDSAVYFTDLKNDGE